MASSEDDVDVCMLDTDSGDDLSPKTLVLQRHTWGMLCRQMQGEYSEFPHHIKRKEDVSIEDVVKDCALNFLPAKSLCRFRTVSKGWNQWIDSPFFAHKQTNSFKNVSGFFCQFPGERSSFISLDPDAYGIPDPSLSFLPEPVVIKTSCNGLLCCRSIIGSAYYICNPVNMEWRMLPEPLMYHGPDTAIALAFEPSLLNFSADFELICAVPLPDQPFLFFEIFSSRSGWRVSNTFCHELGVLKLNNDGFYMKGLVFWQTQSQKVLAFDVKAEDYGILSLPVFCEPTGALTEMHGEFCEQTGALTERHGEFCESTGALTEMHGELCYLLPCKQDDAYAIEVYGDMDMKLKSVIPLDSEVVGTTSNSFRALHFVNDDTLIISFGCNVIAYRARAQKAERLGNTRSDGYEKYLPYVNSLVHVDHSFVAA